jgi:hypothetical protein
MAKPERITFPTIEGSYRGMYPSERDALLKVYRQALKALEIPQGDISAGIMCRACGSKPKALTGAVGARA